MRIAGLVVPPSVFVAGGTAAAWLWAFEQNHVLGGIVAGLSVIAAAFAWVFLRR
ncbi:MAG: hypothetical protein KF830_11810 [Planctomycetes bacterium]|nr:hypothetical protein [Planctomycetota bacterium]